MRNGNIDIVSYCIICLLVLTKSAAQQADKPIAVSLPRALQGISHGTRVVKAGTPVPEILVGLSKMGMSAQSEPYLFVIDGFKASSGTIINPTLIQTFQILENDSIAVLYGCKPVTKAIVITTKRMKEGVLALASSAAGDSFLISNSFKAPSPTWLVPNFFLTYRTIDYGFTSGLRLTNNLHQPWICLPRNIDLTLINIGRRLQVPISCWAFKLRQSKPVQPSKKLNFFSTK